MSKKQNNGWQSNWLLCAWGITFSCFISLSCCIAACVFFSLGCMITGTLFSTGTFFCLGVSLGLDLKGSNCCSFAGISTGLNFRGFRSIGCEVEIIPYERQQSCNNVIRKLVKAQNLVNWVLVVWGRDIFFPPQLSSCSHALPGLLSRLQSSGHRVTVRGNFNINPGTQENNVTHKNSVLKCASCDSFCIFPFSLQHISWLNLCCL